MLSEILESKELNLRVIKLKFVVLAFSEIVLEYFVFSIFARVY